MEIVVTGCTGRLGRSLIREWQGEHALHCLGREDLDFGDPAGLERKLEDLSFGALVNCAAMADVECCESHLQEAQLVNAESPRVLARVCARRGARFIHFSTDYVLDGTREGLKGEGAGVRPLNHYARTKRAGEESVLEENADAIVGRVSWLFGTEPDGIVESVFRSARRGEELRAVADKFSKPTSAGEIGRMVLALLGRPDLAGLFHLTHPGEPESWWSIASTVVRLGYEAGLLEGCPEVQPEVMERVERLRVARPVHTAMDPARLRNDLGWEGVNWEEEVRLRLGALGDRDAGPGLR